VRHKKLKTRRRGIPLKEPPERVAGDKARNFGTRKAGDEHDEPTSPAARREARSVRVATEGVCPAAAPT
jgi:hypothetical protein